MTVNKLFMVGAFPPPVHGMAAVNAEVQKELIRVGIKPNIINIAAKNLKRSLSIRVVRLWRVVVGLCSLLFNAKSNHSILYMSISGGFGQLYEVVFLLIARSRGMHIYLHHHSYSYLNINKMLTRLLTVVAGSDCVHITLSKDMATRLHSLYPSVRRVIPISNAVFFPSVQSLPETTRSSLSTIGFISNIAEEKGIYDFLDLVEACESNNLSIKAKIAGPFQDDVTKRSVMKRLENLNSVEYVGPQYGKDKKLFYDCIDVLVFPTRYANEAEPLTIHEAMQHSIPVIAYGRGSISEIVTSGSGLVIDINLPFVVAAFEKIKQWIDSPQTYNEASSLSGESFHQTLDANLILWKEVVSEMLSDVVAGRLDSTQT